MENIHYTKVPHRRSLSQLARTAIRTPSFSNPDADSVAHHILGMELRRDPVEAMRGSLAVCWGEQHKGTGLATAVQLMGGPLAGAPAHTPDTGRL